MIRGVILFGFIKNAFVHDPAYEAAMPVLNWLDFD
jgi:hypothetical protein